MSSYSFFIFFPHPEHNVFGGGKKIKPASGSAAPAAMLPRTNKGCTHIISAMLDRNTKMKPTKSRFML
jgi:hypothetical protein